MNERVPAVAITGADGFIGKHMSAVCRQTGWTVREIDQACFEDPACLDENLHAVDAVIHLAGINRASDQELEQGNIRIAERLLASLDRTGTVPSVYYSSSIQEELDNPYGRGKRRAGEAIAQWGKDHGARVVTLVIPNVFGPGCRPDYNSVVATFCHKLANHKIPEIHQDKSIGLIHVDDLTAQIASLLQAEDELGARRIVLEPSRRITVAELLAKLRGFADSYAASPVIIPDLVDRFDELLYGTYLSYQDDSALSHRPEVHADDRGELYEVLRLTHGGQFFFSTTKPGITRGGHYHTRKFEWFCVVNGSAQIRLRRIGETDIRKFSVSSESPSFVTIPVFHTHDITNTGSTPLLTLFWCNEVFAPNDTDTFYEPVDLPTGDQHE